MNPYLWTAIHGNDPYPRFYHPSQLLWAEDRLEFSGKRGSTTARQALLAINLAKQEMYWFEPYPVGFVDISRVDLIDIDEVGIFLETTERKIGKLSIRNQVREEGPYNQSIKYTLMMAISGNMNGERLDFFCLGYPSTRTIMVCCHIHHILFVPYVSHISIKPIVWQ